MGRFFFYTVTFFCLISSVVALSAGSMPTEEQVAHIDRQIEELQDVKRGYEGRALWHENLAEYQQFESKNYLETRRHIELAQENREKAAFVQRKIARLESRKQLLLREEQS